MADQTGPTQPPSRLGPFLRNLAGRPELCFLQTASPGRKAGEEQGSLGQGPSVAPRDPHHL